MNGFFDSIPTFAMGGAGTSADLAKQRDRGITYERRTLLRMVTVAGGALALTMLGWIGERTRAAANGRTSLAPGYCLDGGGSGDVPCWGTSNISSGYCAGDGYHRIDTVALGNGYRTYHWHATCGTYAGWKWDGPGGLRSCWDGDYVDIYFSGGTYQSYNICLRSGA